MTTLNSIAMGYSDETSFATHDTILLKALSKLPENSKHVPHIVYYLGDIFIVNKKALGILTRWRVFFHFVGVFNSTLTFLAFSSCSPSQQA